MNRVFHLGEHCKLRNVTASLPIPANGWSGIVCGTHTGDDIISTPPELKGSVLDAQFSLRIPPRTFVREVIPNGLIMSTCLTCTTVLASPTAAVLEMAETAHTCRRLGYDN
jgi:hypothetical protein